MANKRMFSLSVVDTDRFLEMPISSRLLYYELGMRADDDGFVDNWKKILLFTGLKEDDMKVLIAKKFVLPFESGVIVIKHWRMNNYLQSDRKKSTTYQKELGMLDISKGGEYFFKENVENKGSNKICIQNADKVDTQYSIDKYSIDKNSIEYIYNVEDINEVIEYLNKKAETNYKKNTKSTITKIKARFKEGFTIDDFKLVIDKKCEEWKNTEMEKYLRPDTLFGTKFESYLNQKNITKKREKETFNDRLDRWAESRKED